MTALCCSVHTAMKTCFVLPLKTADIVNYTFISDAMQNIRENGHVQSLMSVIGVDNWPEQTNQCENVVFVPLLFICVATDNICLVQTNGLRNGNEITSNPAHWDETSREQIL